MAAVTTEQPSTKPPCLVIRSSIDPNGAFSPNWVANRILTKSFEKGYEIVYSIIENSNEISDIIETTNVNWGDLSFVHIEAHGTLRGGALEFETLYKNPSIADFFHLPCRAPILVDSCLAGVKDGIASKISSVSRNPILAPGNIVKSNIYFFVDPDVGPVLLFYDDSTPPRLTTNAFNLGKTPEELERSMIATFRREAEDGDSLSQLKLALCLENETGIRSSSPKERSRNQREARIWLRKAVLSRLPEAQYYLGLGYNTGKFGLKISKTQSDHFTEQAAKAGIVQAQILKAYDCNNASDKIFWLEKAANNGHIPAMVELGNLYRTSTEIQDNYLAFVWYQRAAIQGDKKGMLLLGFSYLQGIGTESSPRDAFRYLEECTDEYPIANHYMGTYLKSIGENSHAINYLEEAFESGVTEAFVPLVNLYLDNDNYLMAYKLLILQADKPNYRVTLEAIAFEMEQAVFIENNTDFIKASLDIYQKLGVLTGDESEEYIRNEKLAAFHTEKGNTALAKQYRTLAILLKKYSQKR